MKDYEMLQEIVDKLNTQLGLFWMQLEHEGPSLDLQLLIIELQALLFQGLSRIQELTGEINDKHNRETEATA